MAIISNINFNTQMISVVSHGHNSNWNLTHDWFVSTIGTGDLNDRHVCGISTHITVIFLTEIIDGFVMRKTMILMRSYKDIFILSCSINFNAQMLSLDSHRT